MSRSHTIRQAEDHIHGLQNEIEELTWELNHTDDEAEERSLSETIKAKELEISNIEYDIENY